MEKTTTCPCGSTLPAEQCCAAIISGRRKALTAEQLMRSRYTAFTLGDADYLMKSWHPDFRPLSQKNEIRKWARSVKWIKLQILSTSEGRAEDNSGIVKFRALFLEKGKVSQILEESTFTRLDGEWVYVDGK